MVVESDKWEDVVVLLCLVASVALVQFLHRFSFS